MWKTNGLIIYTENEEHDIEILAYMGPADDVWVKALKNSKENAELIVRAVNERQTMIDLLTDVMSDSPDTTTMTYDKIEQFLNTL